MAISTTFLTVVQRSQGSYFLQCENREAGKKQETHLLSSRERGCSKSLLLIRHLRGHIVQSDGINPYEGNFLSFCWPQIYWFYLQILLFPSSNIHMIFWSLFLCCFKRSHFSNSNLYQRVEKWVLKWETSNLTWPWRKGLYIHPFPLQTSLCLEYFLFREMETLSCRQSNLALPDLGSSQAPKLEILMIEGPVFMWPRD